MRVVGCFRSASWTLKHRISRSYRALAIACPGVDRQASSEYDFLSGCKILPEEVKLQNPDQTILFPFLFSRGRHRLLHAVTPHCVLSSPRKCATPGDGIDLCRQSVSRLRLGVLVFFAQKIEVDAYRSSINVICKKHGPEASGNISSS